VQEPASSAKGRCRWRAEYNGAVRHRPPGIPKILFEFGRFAGRDGSAAGRAALPWRATGPTPPPFGTLYGLPRKPGLVPRPGKLLAREWADARSAPMNRLPIRFRTPPPFDLGGTIMELCSQLPPSYDKHAGLQALHHGLGKCPQRGSVA